VNSTLAAELRRWVGRDLMVRVLVLTLLQTLFLSACTTTSNSFLKETSQTQLQQKLLTGASTQTDVKRALGTQYRELISEGELVWVYTYVHQNNLAGNLFPFFSAAQTDDFVKRDLVIYFDSDKRVKNFKLRDHSL
jgi:hypothetical protein